MNAVTTIPIAPEATSQPQTILFSVTAETVKRFEGYRDLKVTDIRDKSQLAAVHAARMELVKARTTVDKIRKEMNEDHNREIKNNNEKAKGLLSLFEPIELHLKSEEDRAEAALEAERVAAKNKLLNDRKTAMAEAVGEYRDILAAYPDDYLSSVSASVFDPLLVSLRVQVEGRKQLAEQQRLAAKAAAKAAADKAESDANAEAYRIKQQAIEDQKRKADQEALEAKIAEFEKQKAEAAKRQRKADEDRAARIAQENADRMKREAVQRAEVQAKLDAQTAELERQRAEIETKRLKCEAEMKRMEEEENERVRVRLEAESTAARLEAEAGEKLAREQYDAAELLRAEEMRPDIEKMCLWITSIENYADEQFPSVSPQCEDLLTELHRDLSCCIDAMRERLT
jgi:hypothetical protein